MFLAWTLIGLTLVPLIPVYFEHVTFDDRINVSKKTLNLSAYTPKHT